MTCEREKLVHRIWKRDSYLISTDAALVPVSELNVAFSSDLVYWAEPLPDHIMRETLDTSLCFGLYEAGANTHTDSDLSAASLKFIGFARCITDFTTFLFLTDVFINPSYQGKGLGAWLVGCIHETIESMPYLRRSMLFTSDWKRSVPFYEKILDMSVVECKRGVNGEYGEGAAIMQKLGPAFPTSLR
ncbi:gcn5-related n-acetyltransferase [Paraphoma chrysanthemicola]|uniref:Gcn5-related n-acetyltransferase n=1 Tax=Paraphoma chrysanthemicola TaxID=798071 RepID=A0A8K0W3Q8_9PLEO|nr:gcn5-related n-acetyltransferase [Paraphoma chrysanthemicola]